MGFQLNLSSHDVLVAGWAKALSHPARISILRTLSQRRTCLCGEIVEELPLAQSTVSQHLRALREAGLISCESDGPRSCYCVDTDCLRRLRAGIDQLLDELEGSSERER